jgi:hypothetical protein
MFRTGRLILSLAFIFSPAVFPVSAGATLLHTWVSASGSDSATCDISAPCKDLLTAYQNTTAGGEITCLNSGDFADSSSQLVIEKSITIDCEGALGSATAVPGGSSLQLILIETSPGAVVVLRGLDFDAAGEGSCGGAGGGLIAFNGGGTLHVQKTKINHAGDGCNGIFFLASGTAELDVSDCDITDNGTSGTGGGIYIVPSSGMTATVSIDRSHINNNYFGILASGKSGGIVKGTISDSVVSGNTEDGIAATSSGSNVWFLVDQTKVAGNAYGVAAGGSGAEILVRNSSVFNNTTGLNTSNGGTIYSYGTNSVNGNATNGAFTGAIGLQ